MADITAKFEIPKEIIDAHIRAALVDSLKTQSDAVIRQIVEGALRTPAPSRYGGFDSNKTIVQYAIEQAIVAETQAGIEEWVAAIRPKIQEMIRAALKAKSDAMLKKMVDNLSIHLANGFDISVFLKDPPAR